MRSRKKIRVSKNKNREWLLLLAIIYELVMKILIILIH